MLLKVTGKVSLGRDIRYSSIYCIHGYCYCSLFLLLFALYTITVIVTVLLLLLSPYRSSILDNMDVDWFNWIE